MVTGVCLVKGSIAAMRYREGRGGGLLQSNAATHCSHRPVSENPREREDEKGFFLFRTVDSTEEEAGPLTPAQGPLDGWYSQKVSL